MKRALIIALMIALPIAAVIAQPPPGTPPPIPTAGGPTPTPFAPADDNNLPPGLSGVQQPTATPTLIELVPEVTAEVLTEDELGVDAVDPSDPTPLLIRARADINTLVDDLLGADVRPEGWSGLTTTDIDNPDFLLLTRLDLEILAGLIAGAEVRPEGWFGANASSDYAIARDIRHDLELLADTHFNGITRPTAWNGDDPILRCDRATQTLVRLLEINGLFTVEVDPQAADYCQQVEIAASRFAEVNLLANPMMNGTLTDTASTSGTYVVNSDFAVGFLDRGAAQRLGVIPNGTVIAPIARSPAQFSNMMLVRGEGFEVFVDFQFTDVTEDIFDDLPDVDTVEAVPFCDAEWCAG